MTNETIAKLQKQFDESVKYEASRVRENEHIEKRIKNAMFNFANRIMQIHWEFVCDLKKEVASTTDRNGK